MKVALLATDDREHFKDYGAPTPRFGTAVEALLQGFAQLPEIELHVLSCTQKPMASAEKPAPNIWYHSLLVPKIGWMRTGYQGCIRATRKLLRRLQPDIVHGQGTERDCAVSAVLSGFPNVITIHGNMRLIARVNKAKPLSYLWLAARLERFTLPRADGVICISRYTQDAVVDLARRTWVAPNAVDRGFFELEREPSPRPMILCVGHITSRKNQNAFIRALDDLSRVLDFELVCAGNAELHTAYVQEFLGLIQQRAWCAYLGSLDRHQLKQQLSAAHLLIVPSIEENCPMVVLEAMAAAVPVAAARVGGIPELIDEQRTGFLFDPTNAADAARTVERALNDRPLLDSMAERARTEARSRFHPQVIAIKHAEVYRELALVNTQR